MHARASPPLRSCRSALTVPPLGVCNARRIGDAQDRIQALQGSAKDEEPPSPAPAPPLPKAKAKKEPKAAKEPKQPKQQKQQKKKERAPAPASAAAKKLETVAPAGDYSAEFSWCAADLPVGTGVLSTSSSAASAGTVSGSPIAGGKASEGSPGGCEFVAWETQAEDEAAKKLKQAEQAEAAAALQLQKEAKAHAAAEAKILEAAVDLFDGRGSKQEKQSAFLKVTAQAAAQKAEGKYSYE